MSEIKSVRSWAEETTRPGSNERERLIRAKVTQVESFFDFSGKTAREATAEDVAAWRDKLRKKISARRVYDRLTLLSSYLDAAGLFNPVPAVRGPKPPDKPTPLQKETLSDDTVRRVFAGLRSRAATGDLISMRDYAMLLVFMVTEMRRETLAKLNTADVRFEGSDLIVRYAASTEVAYRKKDVRKVEQRITEPQVVRALRDYMRATNRLGLRRAAIFTGHGQGQESSRALSIPTFTISLRKQYERDRIEEAPELLKYRWTYQARLRERVAEATHLIRRQLIRDLHAHPAEKI